MSAPILKLASGSIEVAVWENEHEGRKFRSVTCQRSYKDQTGAWQRTQSFPGRDLPTLANLLLEAWRACEIREPGKKEPPAPAGVPPAPSGPPPREEEIPF